MDVIFYVCKHALLYFKPIFYEKYHDHAHIKLKKTTFTTSTLLSKNKFDTERNLVNILCLHVQDMSFKIKLNC